MRKRDKKDRKLRSTNKNSFPVTLEMISQILKCYLEIQYIVKDDQISERKK